MAGGSIGKITNNVQMPDGSIPGGLTGQDRTTAATEIALNNAMAAGSFLFKKGVVVEVINDVYELNVLMQEEEPYADKIVNANVAAVAPRNSTLMKSHEDEEEARTTTRSRTRERSSV